jgi:uncharacterized protein YjbI with pentapeptide repeats
MLSIENHQKIIYFLIFISIILSIISMVIITKSDYQEKITTIENIYVKNKDLNTILNQNYVSKDDLNSNYYTKDKIDSKFTNVDNTYVKINDFNITNSIIDSKFNNVDNTYVKINDFNIINAEINSKFNNLDNTLNLTKSNLESLESNLNSNYYTKDNINDADYGYVLKSEIPTILSGYYSINRIDSAFRELNDKINVEYYTKNDIESNYYNKKYINNYFYKNYQIDYILNTKQGVYSQNNLNQNATELSSYILLLSNGDVYDYLTKTKVSNTKYPVMNNNLYYFSNFGIQNSNDGKYFLSDDSTSFDNEYGIIFKLYKVNLSNYVKSFSDTILKREIFYRLLDINPLVFSYELQPLIDFSNLDLSNTDLSEKNLSNIILSGVNFRNTSLDKSIFNNSILRDVNFEGASCNECSFQGANMTRAKLSGGNFSYSDFTNVICDKEEDGSIVNIFDDSGIVFDRIRYEVGGTIYKFLN